ncbi:MAG: Cof-type HAD-IIB family hydrolase [Alkalibacterium sp.]|uniref:Cof-type HAD-IIB family hydrolase n=1 Tax=Alkalibacterium sp. TaxID=1872447 RepID=UPI0026481436|nr:Cof-type HAD-IIB family hydrolase [Alkalibacterium sp.]MDN6295411.1 Cof-type HAD-IIB family hydrolase [Alkalibacterium sp.]MDN6398765.1 Cof-type HAD-IIB family hydrolase [Alkalibacterium sp.]
MQKKLIALDLDGTTLNNQSQITKETQYIIEKLKKEGHIVSIITGRPYRNSHYYYKQLTLDTPIVNFNGAWMHNPSQKSFNHGYHKTLSKDLALSMLSLKDNPDVQLIAAESQTSIYIEGEYIPYPDFFPEGIQMSKQLRPDILQEDPTSIGVFTTTSNYQKKIEQSIIEKYKGSVEVRMWGGTTPCLEVVAAGVQKAMGLERIAAYYNVSRENILAFGDQENDYEMIEYAGHGVVMSNGTKRLKSISNDITQRTNDENGLADYLKDYFKL